MDQAMVMTTGLGQASECLPGADIIIGGDDNYYGMGFTDEGTIAIKNDLANLAYMKTHVFQTMPMEG